MYKYKRVQNNVVTEVTAVIDYTNPDADYEYMIEELTLEDDQPVSGKSINAGKFNEAYKAAQTGKKWQSQIDESLWHDDKTSGV
jgi:hypothetical protein